MDASDSRLGDTVVFINQVERPALPVEWSDTIVVGTIIKTQSFVTRDKSNVFTEYQVSVADVFASASGASVSAGQTVTVERQGGCVKLPSGLVRELLVAQQGVLRPKSKYVLFLRYVADGNDFRVVTGYAVDRDVVRVVDDERQFHAYDNSSERRLFSDIRAAVAMGKTGKHVR